MSKNNLQFSRPLDYGDRTHFSSMPEYANRIGLMFTELIQVDLDDDEAASRFIEQHFPARIERDTAEMRACLQAGAILADEIWKAFHSWEPIDRLSIAVNRLPTDRRIGTRRANVISLMNEFDFYRNGPDDEFWPSALSRSAPEFRKLTTEVMASEHARWRKSDDVVSVFNVAAAMSIEVGAFGDAKRRNETVMQARLRVSNTYRNAWKARHRVLVSRRGNTW